MTSCTPTEPCEVYSSETPDFSATRRTDKTTVLCWALWDMGSAAFNAVLVTFVFSVYLISSVGENIDSRFSASSWYSLAIAAGGIAIALLAPVLGQRSDARGTRRKSVRRWTAVTFVFMLTLFFIRDDASIYFWVGISIMAIASVTYELAEVSYFAMLNQISTEKNVGRISGFGWSLGYFGGIILLAICYFGFIAGSGGLFAFPTEGGFNVRIVAIFAAAWFIIFCLPVMFRVPEVPPNPAIVSGGIKTSYVELFRTIATLWRKQRSSVFFLISSAIFRDGVAAVFTFGAILAVSVFGLSAGDVLVFGIAANVIAGFGALGAGYLDDKFGPKPVILVSLVSMVITAGILFVVEGPKNFWIFGLILCLFVGPIQSSSRTFLSRMAPVGHEGQMFGLYATTGRAVSWLAPLAFTAFVWIFGTDRAGILGIGLVLLAGAGVLIFVREPRPALAPFEDAVKA